MSESIDERLSRFTPDAGGLDRDALLFAAGRASVRPRRRWMVLAGTLAASQLLTLVLLWPRTSPPGTPVVVESTPRKVAPAPVDKHELPPALVPESSPSSSTLLALRQQYLGDDGPPAPPGPIDDLVPDAPPLRAFPVSSDVFPN